MYKKLFLIVILFVSIIWQPSHHYLMAHGVSMSSELHSLTTIIPFLAILLLIK